MREGSVSGERGDFRRSLAVIMIHLDIKWGGGGGEGRHLKPSGVYFKLELFINKIHLKIKTSFFDYDFKN